MACWVGHGIQLRTVCGPKYSEANATLFWKKADLLATLGLGFLESASDQEPQSIVFKAGVLKCLSSRPAVKSLAGTG